MHSSRALLAAASVAGCLPLGADGFAALTTSKTFNTLAPCSTSTRTDHNYRDRVLLHRSLRAPRYATTHHRDSVLMAAGGGKKRKRRKSTATTSSGAGAVATQANVPAAGKLPVSGGGSTDGQKYIGDEPGDGVAGMLGDVLQGDRAVEALFSDDWSGMQANAGMVKSKVDLPDISTYVPKNRPAAETLEQRRKKRAVGLTIGVVPPEKEQLPNLKDFKSKLPPLVDREEEAYAKMAAERFEEGPIVKGLKTATWFAICALVAWEIYINSPWFPGVPTSPLSS